MAKTYSKMPEETTERVAHLCRLFHPELLKCGVTIDLISVSTTGERPALTLHRVPCLAVVRVTNIKERTKGLGDAEIVFDEEKYLKLSDEEKDALCDHELEHLEIRRDKKTNAPLLDCRGRVKMRTKPHDYDFGWFVNIAERHGMAALECKQAASLFVAEKQTLFAFINQPHALESGQARS